MRKLICLVLVLSTFSVASAQNDVSLREKVARMLIIGFRGTEINDKTPVVVDIKERKIGGIILFEHNITPVEKKLDSKARLKAMCAKIRELADYPIIISIDQEGGKVNRLKTKYGFVPSVTQEYLGKLDKEDSTRMHASSIAQQLVDLGLNTNFTPCVDVNVNRNCPVIAKVGRSFSTDENKVIEHGEYVIDEHNSRGVITAIKHFPGHGSSAADSHEGFTDVTSTWQERELEPFKALLSDESQNMVMISHVFNKNIDDTYPATLSDKTINGLLRQEIGWDGVVITDDMHMKAISDHYSLKEALTLTINAGTDMIILSSNIPGNTDPISEQAIDAIVEQVKAGVITEERINESFNRINKLLIY
ncbi:MAG: glycoside hydrolase family 3 N-terminal domain-containing protein [Rikenellaceae bacterium]